MSVRAASGVNAAKQAPAILHSWLLPLRKAGTGQCSPAPPPTPRAWPYSASCARLGLDAAQEENSWRSQKKHLPPQPGAGGWRGVGLRWWRESRSRTAALAGQRRRLAQQYVRGRPAASPHARKHSRTRTPRLTADVKADHSRGRWPYSPAHQKAQLVNGHTHAHTYRRWLTADVEADHHAVARLELLHVGAHLGRVRVCR